VATLIAAGVLAVSLTSIQNILIVALGLGLVIFFHELGHFAVAKWCDVNVERFSIGFGPILLSKKYGETEYALSLIPFGGYVKMLGQDDADPAQLTSEEVAEDPRSYIAKNVPQRMAIISAGVIMNIITGMIFFAMAFQAGVEVQPAEVGTVITARPAWEAGLRQGDRLTEINGRDAETFGDIIRATALSSSDHLDVKGVRQDGTEFSTRIIPEMSGTRREIGVAPVLGRQIALAELVAGGDPIVPGSAASQADPPLEAGDTILGIDDEQIEGFPELQDVLARKRSETITFHLRRMQEDDKSEELKSVVPAQGFRQLGLWMDIGQIDAVQSNSPAEEAGVKPGDKIVSIDGQDVGKDINPLVLPDYFADRAGEEIAIVVTREEKGSGAKNHELTLTPRDFPGWIEQPLVENTPLSVPSIGIAFHLIPTVLKVQEGSPAEGKVKTGDQIQQIKLVLPEEIKKPDGLQSTEPVTIKLDGSNQNYAYAFWQMQRGHERNVELTIQRNSETAEVVKLSPVRSEEWFLPIRGMAMMVHSTEQQADSFGEALQMGVTHTKNSALDIYLTLRNLVTQNLSVKELHGPIGIAKVAYQVSQQGIAELSMFLGFLSINLAVLNFLPIPVLDGGHMVFLIYEGITRRKPSEKVLIIATYVGMLFVLSLMVLVIFLDVFVHGFGS